MPPTLGERRRWQFFVDLMKAYLSELAAAGKADPNEAQLNAIRNNSCRVTRPLVLIGTTDISKLLVSMLAQVESSKNSAAITALVAAPDSHAKRFDSFGNLNAGRWQSHCLPLQDGQLIPAGDISDQTAAVMETLSELGQKSRSASPTNRKSNRLRTAVTCWASRRIVTWDTASVKPPSGV